MMELSKYRTENPVQLDDFCRLCLLRKPHLRPLSNQIQTMLIPEMLYKVTGTLLNMYDQLPRVICERCLVKLELAYSIAEEFRKQQELLRRLSWKGVLLDQLLEYQHSEESWRKPYSEMVIERLIAVDNATIPLEAPDLQRQVSVGFRLVDSNEDFGMGQPETIAPIDNQLQIAKAESLDVAQFSIEVLPDEPISETDAETERKQQPKEIIDNGLKMVLELEDLRTIGAVPDELLEQLDMQQSPEDAPESIHVGGYVVSSLAELEEEQSDDDKDTDYVPYDQDALACFAESEPAPEEGQFRCDICNKCYGTKDEVYVHHLARHKGSRKPWKYECKYCQQRFERKSKKENHEKSHEHRLQIGVPGPNKGPHQCPICHKRYHSRHNYNEHMRRHNSIDNGKFRCKTCTRPFGGLAELRRHEKLHEQRAEWRMAHDNIPPPILIVKGNNTIYKCGECQHISANNFMYVQHAQRHLIRKAGMFQCQDCGKCYAIKKYLRHHQRNVHKLFIKPEPDDKETNMSNMPAPPVEIDKRLPHCSECDAFFLSPVDYKIHMCVHGTGFNQKSSDNEATGEDCQLLEGATPKGPPVVLPSTSIELDESMALGSDWKCDECGETVTLRSDGTYREHRRKHERIRHVTMKCEDCKIAFSTHTELRRHRVANHGFVSHKNRDTTEQCPWCRKEIKKNHLQKHTKMHENISLRKYLCVKCDTALGTQQHLKFHVESGICEKPGYVPRVMDALSMEGLKEYFTCEDNQTTSTCTESPTIIDEHIGQIEGQFKCKECGIMLKNLAGANKHAKRHTILKAGIYTCEICKKVFGAKSDLKRHIEHVH